VPGANAPQLEIRYSRGRRRDRYRNRDLCFQYCSTVDTRNRSSLRIRGNQFFLKPLPKTFAEEVPCPQNPSPVITLQAKFWARKIFSPDVRWGRTYETAQAICRGQSAADWNRSFADCPSHLKSRVGPEGIHPGYTLGPASAIKIILPQGFTLTPNPFRVLSRRK
jgi:hypothetical protein